MTCLSSTAVLHAPVGPLIRQEMLRRALRRPARGRSRESAAKDPTRRCPRFDFNMLGALLRLDRPRDARPRLAVRVSSDGVAWGPWRTLVFASAEGRAASAGHAGATASEPLWVGDACYVQYRLTVGGRPATRRTITRLRFAFINSMGHDAADALPATMTSFAALAGAATAGRSTTVADFPLAPRATSSRRSGRVRSCTLRGAAPPAAALQS